MQGPGLDVDEDTRPCSLFSDNLGAHLRLGCVKCGPRFLSLACEAWITCNSSSRYIYKWPPSLLGHQAFRSQSKWLARFVCHGRATSSDNAAKSSLRYAPPVFCFNAKTSRASTSLGQGFCKTRLLYRVISPRFPFLKIPCKTQACLALHLSPLGEPFMFVVCVTGKKVSIVR